MINLPMNDMRQIKAFESGSVFSDFSIFPQHKPNGNKWE